MRGGEEAVEMGVETWKVGELDDSIGDTMNDDEYGDYRSVQTSTNSWMRRLMNGTARFPGILVLAGAVGNCLRLGAGVLGV